MEDIDQIGAIIFEGQVSLGPGHTPRMKDNRFSLIFPLASL